MDLSGLILELIKVLLFAVLPVAVISFCLVFLAIKRGYINPEESVESLNKKRKQAKKNKAEFKVNPIHNKWLYFGGGYYGLMAFTTFMHVEILEIYNFLAGFISFSALLDQISVAGIISLIIDSFMNIIPAFTWFLYWPDFIDMQHGWYWLGGSYAGYYIGEIVARQLIVREIKGEIGNR